MANQFDPRYAVAREGAMSRADIDQGLRKYMLGVYNYMASGILLTGMIALAVSAIEPLRNLVLFTPFKWVALFAPLGLVMFFSFRINQMAASTAQMIFWAFAGTMGLSLASIFLVYSGISIAKTFFITSATFGALSLYGYTTKKDLSGFGTFLIMGLFGLIIASLVNLFLKSSAVDFVVSIVGVLIFAGLTAYDTQKIKEMYWNGDGYDVLTKKIVSGALALYMDFINLFLFLLRFLGNRNN